MTLRKAHPQEAEILWNIRNQAIRHGCKTSYDADVIARWTPDDMPEQLDATPNARSFYQKLGFVTLSEKYHHSRMAGADLRCFEMAINL
ncbi:hypothetical protein ACS6LB_12320 [Enterobacter cloacae]|uniref:hypothetical protein n=1 Tax=Enterobacter cloacae TaxID=550 RepID=UPI002AFAB304|nr:hypothetical protein [Enterobacter cloacae]HDC4525842.1 hypothetical protein [Enterobacter cloacae]